jgi:fructose-1,6-bisphosphatase
MKAIDELRKIIAMPDQKHWNYVEMRERALEEWLEKWMSHLIVSQSVVNVKNLPSEVEDYMKEQLFMAMLDSIMEESAIITKEKNKITGELICLRRNPKP